MYRPDSQSQGQGLFSSQASMMPGLQAPALSQQPLQSRNMYQAAAVSTAQFASNQQRQQPTMLGSFQRPSASPIRYMRGSTSPAGQLHPWDTTTCVSSRPHGNRSFDLHIAYIGSLA